MENSENSEKSVKYQIIDSKTGEKVGKPYKSRRMAHARADKLDLEYGAVRYSVKNVLTETASGGSVGAGSIAVNPGRLGDMRKRESLKQFLVRTYKKLANRLDLKPVHMPVIKEYYDLSDVVSRLKGVESLDWKKDNSVTFGVEDDKGNVMKVTVKKEQAKEFEYKLARDLSDAKTNNLSGATKLSLAELLYNLKDDFDIIDVEFPTIPKDVIYNADEATKAPPNAGMEEPNDEINDQDFENGENNENMDLNGEEGLENGETGEEGLEPDDESVENFEEEPEQVGPESILQSVMDMLKADAEAKKAQADAEAEKARAQQAEYSYKASQATVAHEEELAKMESEIDSQKQKEKEAKRLADLAKYRVQKTSGMREEVSILGNVINELDDFETQQTIQRERQNLSQKYRVVAGDTPQVAQYKKTMLQRELAELNDKRRAVQVRDTFKKNQDKIQKDKLVKDKNAENNALKTAGGQI